MIFLVYNVHAKFIFKNYCNSSILFIIVIIFIISVNIVTIIFKFSIGWYSTDVGRCPKQERWTLAY